MEKNIYNSGAKNKTCFRVRDSMLKNIWRPMPLFLDIYFKYRYSMEVDEKIYTYNISVKVCLWFFLLDVGLQIG